jgi:DNA repair protein RadC
MSIKDWPEDERPREKLLKYGSHSLSDAELLAIFLRVGTRGQSAIELARSLIQHFGSLNQLMSASASQFCAHPGMGPAKYTQLQATLEMSKRCFQNEIQDSCVITSPEATHNFLRSAILHKNYEVFGCLYLNSQHQVLSFEELFKGTIDSASVYPREVVTRVLDNKAAAVIFCHNHPSGSPKPSQADIALTKRLIDALSLIDVRVLDHMIVAGSEVTSMAELGLL